MLDFLAQYSMREKAIVAVALLVVIIIGTHAIVIEPYQTRADELRAEIEQQNTDLVWMRSAVTRMPAAGTSTNTVAINGTLANFIDQAVRSQGLSGQLSQMSPIGSDEVRMRYNAVEFNRLVGFIAQVSSRGLKIKDIRITSADTPGIVDSSLVLVRP